MITIYKAESRYEANHGWLLSKFSFSFAEYFDPNNLQFGPMRVLNDDIVQPNNGFGMHPHREMEIVSIVLKGHLQHEDTALHKSVTTFGEIQRMSAGTGVYHSEMNPSATEEVNFLQLWFLPEQYNLQPSYEKTKYPIEKMKNNLLAVVTKNPTEEGIAHINQDLTIYLSELDDQHELTFTQEKNRRIFLFVIDGSMTINNNYTLSKRDSARITETPSLTIKANKPTTFMLIDLP
ncbi:MAG TPA: pirin family protein [Massilibacterium sp.]|nr:pirin family protein [Massilibacterium sp.]